jgi:hypothetical protein
MTPRLLASEGYCTHRLQPPVLGDGHVTDFQRHQRSGIASIESTKSGLSWSPMVAGAGPA